MDLIISILPVVTKDLPILSRCKYSTLTTRQPMAEFYLLTFPRFPLRKKEHKSYFGKNRTHDFRTSRWAGYLLDHSGNEAWNHRDKDDMRQLAHFLRMDDTKFGNSFSGAHILAGRKVTLPRCMQSS